jgi:signal transduction histidine kinase
MQEVVDNLISNAVKYSPTGKRIWVAVKHIKFSHSDDTVLQFNHNFVQPSTLPQT